MAKNLSHEDNLSLEDIENMLRSASTGPHLHGPEIRCSTDSSKGWVYKPAGRTVVGADMSTYKKPYLANIDIDRFKYYKDRAYAATLVVKPEHAGFNREEIAAKLLSRCLFDAYEVEGPCFVYSPDIYVRYLQAEDQVEIRVVILTQPASIDEPKMLVDAKLIDEQEFWMKVEKIVDMDISRFEYYKNAGIKLPESMYEVLEKAKEDVMSKAKDKNIPDWCNEDCTKCMWKCKQDGKYAADSGS